MSKNTLFCIGTYYIKLEFLEIQYNKIFYATQNMFLAGLRCRIRFDLDDIVKYPYINLDQSFYEGWIRSRFFLKGL